MTTHFQRALILYRCWRFINHLLTYWLFSYYCVGRTKLEPVAIVVLSVIMSLASIQMIRQSVERIVAYAQYDIESASRRNGSMVLCVPIDEMEDYVPSGTDSRPVFEIDSIVICVVTVGQYNSCRASHARCLYLREI